MNRLVGISSEKPPQTEEELLGKSIRGDTVAYGRLVKLYMERAYYLALSFVRSRDEALDLSQEAFVRVWRSLKTFDPAKGFFPFYYSTLRNLCLNAIRNSNRRATRFSDLPGEEWLERKIDDTGRFDDQPDLPLLVVRTLDELDSSDREIILLKDMHGYSYREIGELLSIPMGTVMSRLHAARSRFRSIIRRLGYEHA